MKISYVAIFHFLIIRRTFPRLHLKLVPITIASETNWFLSKSQADLNLRITTNFVTVQADAKDSICLVSGPETVYTRM